MQERYVDGSYVDKNPSFHIEDSPWKAQQILKILGRSRLSPKRICEVGCGAGAILEALQHQMPTDCTFVGYDISPQGIALARRRSNERLSFVLGDFLEAEGVYDLILCMDVIEHIEDIFGFLTKIRHRAGKIIFHIPLELSVLNILNPRPVMYSHDKFGHVHFFTKDTALSTLTDGGYAIIDTMYTGTLTELNAGDSVTNITQGLRRGIGNFGRRIGYRVSPELTVRTLGGYSLLALVQEQPETPR